MASLFLSWTWLPQLPLLQRHESLVKGTIKPPREGWTKLRNLPLQKKTYSSLNIHTFFCSHSQPHTISRFQRSWICVIKLIFRFSADHNRGSRRSEPQNVQLLAEAPSIRGTDMHSGREAPTHAQQLYLSFIKSHYCYNRSWSSWSVPVLAGALYKALTLKCLVLSLNFLQIGLFGFILLAKPAVCVPNI